MKYDYKTSLVNRIVISIKKKLFEPMTGAIKDTSENLTKTITKTYINNNKVLENLNEKF